MLSGHIGEVRVSRGQVKERLVEGAGHMTTLTLQSVCGCVGEVEWAYQSTVNLPRDVVKHLASDHAHSLSRELNVVENILQPLDTGTVLVHLYL